MEERPAVPQHYEILEVVHEGSTGSVLKVRNELLGEIRALKLLDPRLAAADGFRERFSTWAHELPRLEHPHLVKVFGVHLTDDTAYLEMEYVDGESLGDVLSSGERPPLDESLSIAQQSLEALAFLHAQGQVHGLVSPDHLIVGTNGSRHVKLLHTGIVGLVELEDGEMLGRSWHYASPEQRIPGRRVTPSSDTYAMGMVLCELLAEIDPYSDDEVANLDSILANGSIELPPSLRQLLRQAIREHPDDRFACAKSFAEALAEFDEGQRIDGPSSREEPSAPGEASREPSTFATDAAEESLLEEDPAQQVARLRLESEELVAQSRYPEALDRLRIASRLAPEDDSLRDLARVVREAGIAPLLGDGARHLLAGDHESAAGKIAAALELDPTHSRALAMRQQLEEAVDTIEVEVSDPSEERSFESVFREANAPPLETVAPPIDRPFSAESDEHPRTFADAMRTAPAAPPPLAPSGARARRSKVRSASRFPWAAGVGVLAVVAAILIWFPDAEPTESSPRSTDGAEPIAASTRAAQPAPPSPPAIGAAPTIDIDVPSTAPSALPADPSSGDRRSADRAAPIESPAAIPPADALPSGTIEIRRSGEPRNLAIETGATSGNPEPDVAELFPSSLDGANVEDEPEPSAPAEEPLGALPAPSEKPEELVANRDLSNDDGPEVPGAAVSAPDASAPISAPSESEKIPVRIATPERPGTPRTDPVLQAQWDAVVPPEIPADDRLENPDAETDPQRIAGSVGPSDRDRAVATRPEGSASPTAVAAPDEAQVNRPRPTIGSAPRIGDGLSIPSAVVVEPPAPPKEVQQERIRRTLDRFEHAHATIDMAELRAIWPSLQGSQLRAFSESFADAKSMKTKVRDCSYRIERATATAACTVAQTYRPVGGKRHSVERRVDFGMRRAGETWQIESIGPSQP